jgi:hypothetical protein
MEHLSEAQQANAKRLNMILAFRRAGFGLGIKILEHYRRNIR